MMWTLQAGHYIWSFDLWIRDKFVCCYKIIYSLLVLGIHWKEGVISSALGRIEHLHTIVSIFDCWDRWWTLGSLQLLWDFPHLSGLFDQAPEPEARRRELMHKEMDKFFLQGSRSTYSLFPRYWGQLS